MKRDIKLEMNNSVLLVASSDIEICGSIKKEFFFLFKNILIAQTKDEARNLIRGNKIDYAIIDTNINNEISTSLCSVMNLKKDKMKKIIITDTSNEHILIEAINCGAYMVIEKPLDFSHLKIAMIMSINQENLGKKLFFKQGITYDIYSERFYKNGNPIVFTRLESALLKFLISKKNEVVDYSLINKLVWNDKKMSLYTLRNVVRNIRLKTYQDIIDNYSSNGYCLSYKK